MFTMIRRTAALVALVAAASSTAADVPAFAGSNANRSVPLELDTAAEPSTLGLHRPLIGIARAGSRLVTVGRMGHVYWSDDGGAKWSQAKVPVSVDLVAVAFPTPQKGWAVGHDGVVLASLDGGESWTLQLDGRKAAALMVAYYRNLVALAPPAAPAASPDEELPPPSPAQSALSESERFEQEQGARPFLDVWFDNDRDGFVVGAWGLILRTQDGGATWEPWMHQVDNPRMLHLNAIAGAGQHTWIVGERGLILRRDCASDRFQAVPADYDGSYFGVLGIGDAVVAYGLRGSVFRSTDEGATWSRVPIAGQAGIAAGVTLDPRNGVLVDTAGTLWRSRDAGATFSPFMAKQPMPYYGVAWMKSGSLALVGALGVDTLAMPTPSSTHQE